MPDAIDVIKVEDKKQTKDLGDRYSLRITDTNNVDVVDRDTDAVNQLEKHDDGIHELNIISRPQRIVAHGNDHRIVVYDYSANKIAEGIQHSEDFAFIQQLPGDEQRLITANLDGRVVLYDLGGKESPVIFEAEISKPTEFIIQNNELLMFVEKDRASIWEIGGTQLVALTDLPSPPQQVRLLSSGRWLVRLQSSNSWAEVSLHDPEGKKIGKLERCKDLNTDVLETSDNHLIFSLNGQLSLYQPDAQCKSRPNISSKIVDKTKELVQIQRDIDEEQLTDDPDINKVPHVMNPVGTRIETTYANDSSSTRRAFWGHEANKTDNRLWSFFYRPSVMWIQNLFKDDYRKISRIREVLDEATEEWEDIITSQERKAGLRIKLGVFFALVALVLFMTGLSDLQVQSAPALDQAMADFDLDVTTLFFYMGGGGFVLLALFGGFLPAQNAKSSSRGAQERIELIEKVKDHAQSIKDTISSVRSVLMRQVPTLKNGKRYSDDEAYNVIENKIHSDVRRVAMSECGLEEQDLTGEGLPENLKAWALLQEPENVEKHSDNILAFAISKNKTYIFAIQYVQFIFPSANKLDTFSCYYDAVKDKIYDKAAQTFFYRDVTNLTKKDTPIDVTNAVGTGKGDSIKATASQITLSVSSGENISVTISNSDFNDQIQKEVQKKRENANKDGNLERRLAEIDQDNDLTDEEKAEEKAALREELNAPDDANATDSDASSAQDQQKDADRIIAYIRKQLRELKEV